jgi:hypothetical protein
MTILVTAVLALAACGGGGGDDDSEVLPNATTVEEYAIIAGRQQALLSSLVPEASTKCGKPGTTGTVAPDCSEVVDRIASTADDLTNLFSEIEPPDLVAQLVTDTKTAATELRDVARTYAQDPCVTNESGATGCAAKYEQFRLATSTLETALSGWAPHIGSIEE